MKTLRKLAIDNELLPDTKFVIILKEGQVGAFMGPFRFKSYIMDGDTETPHPKYVVANWYNGQEETIHINHIGAIVTELRNLDEGDDLFLVYGTGVDVHKRYLSQKGKIEGYCPIYGQNTMGHSKAGGEEVYLLSTNVIKIPK